mmetsp:Transcript_15285/g.31427  ORF Transcript_15285/g.31427 Transcript_15285/m.31427 type:complete len:509 (-) Transcript_15285:233-1759(-)
MAVPPKTLYLDVRSAEEVAMPPFLPATLANLHIHVPSKEVAVAAIEAFVDLLPSDKQAPIAVFCAHGVRAAWAISALNAKGYDNVRNVVHIRGAISEADTAQSNSGNSHLGDDDTASRRAPANKGRLELVAELDHGSGEANVWCVAWAPHGRFLASCGGDNAIRVWGERRHAANAPASWVCLAVLDEGQQRTIRNLQWSPCGRYIASVSFDATCAVWELQSKYDADRDEDDGGSPGSGNSALEMRWELAAQLEGHENEVKGVCWSTDGSLLATCGRDKSVWVWEVVDLASCEFECLSVLQEHTQDVKQVKFHPRGLGAAGQGLLVSASYDDTLKLWAEDGDDWVCAQTLVGHNSTVWSLAFGPPAGEQQESIVSVSDDTSVMLWQQSASAAQGGSASGWACSHRVSKAHERAIYSVDWCPHGHNAVATGGADNALRLWRLDSSSQELVLEVEVAAAHDGDVNSVAWAPLPRSTGTEGSGMDKEGESWDILATGGDDGHIRLWRYSEAA